jgi:hypothetical protein
MEIALRKSKDTPTPPIGNKAKTSTTTRMRQPLARLWNSRQSKPLPSPCWLCAVPDVKGAQGRTTNAQRPCETVLKLRNSISQQSSRDNRPAHAPSCYQRNSRVSSCGPLNPFCEAAPLRMKPSGNRLRIESSADTPSKNSYRENEICPCRFVWER